MRRQLPVLFLKWSSLVSCISASPNTGLNMNNPEEALLRKILALESRLAELEIRVHCLELRPLYLETPVYGPKPQWYPYTLSDIVCKV